MSEHIKNEKGATSILVIFMMIVLVTLGAFAITSANVNYKFSMRTLNWNKMYFDLDSKGEEYLLSVDNKLAEAEKMAYDYIQSEGFSKEKDTGLPDEMQMDIYNQYQSNNGQTEFLTDVMNYVYMHYADQYLNELEYEFSQIYPWKSQNFIESIFAINSFPSEDIENNTCSLNITLLVEPIEYNISGMGNSYSLVRSNDNPRFTIEDWYEYQEPWEEEEQAMEIWDGSII